MGVTEGLKFDGSVLHIETIRDIQAYKKITDDRYLKGTIDHEVGHQFGLDHASGNIMEKKLPDSALFFF